MKEMFKKWKRKSFKKKEADSSPVPNPVTEGQTSFQGSLGNIKNQQTSQPRKFTNMLPPTNSSLDSVPFRRATNRSSTSRISENPFIVNDLLNNSESSNPIIGTTAGRNSNVSAVPEYKTNGPKRSKVLIINNVKFGNPKLYRHGAQEDEVRLIKMFNEFNFDVECKRNLKKKEMLKLVKEFRSCNSLNDYDICFVIIMSHGGNKKKPGGYTRIKGVDNKGIFTEKIIDEFTVENCPAMKGKPKIFIFQCCRGKLDYKTVTDARPFTPLRTKNNADVLITYSTLADHISNRHCLTGTHYIQCICDVFQKNAKKLDIEDMLKIVDSEMTSLYPAYGQTSTYENRGFKKCYLNPE